MLKLVGLIIMTIDTIGIAFFPNQLIFRLVGRLALPIFAFFIALGAKRTRHIDNYINRILLFAFVSQFPYIFFRPDIHQGNMSIIEMFFKSYLPGLRPIPGFSPMIFPGIVNSPGLNIGFTFAMALVAIKFLEKGRTEKEDKFKSILCYFMVLIIILSAFFIRVDFGAYGVAMVLLFYNNPIEEKSIFGKLFMILPLLINLFLMMIQSITLLSVPLIRLMKDRKADLLPRWIYYLYYPLHFFLFGTVLYFL